MDSKKPMPVYEDFDVHTEWVREFADDTLIAYLPGFKKEEIKIQVTTGGKLKIFGKRPLGSNKFSRFNKEIPIPPNYDQNKISANFKDGKLHVKCTKLQIVPADEKQQEQAKASAQTDSPRLTRPADVPQKQNNGVEEATSKATTRKKTGDEQTDRTAKEADNVSQKAPDKRNVDANESDKPMDQEKTGRDKEENTSTSEKREKLGDSVQDAAEKENAEPKELDGTDKYQLTGINSTGWPKYKQVLDGLAKGLNNPRKIMNVVLAVLLVVVLAVYLRNAIRSLRNY
ncbi:hypothetical protein DITRI_Ditri14bG0032300 [Diplodiscus trichospermus]